MYIYRTYFNLIAPVKDINAAQDYLLDDDMTKYLTYHALPPYNSDGTTKKISRVFIQDFMTTANFVIGPNSLKYAYLTVPDLRSSSLSLGLSVDIKWETGLNFSNIVLGGTD
jgi:hypothetical protein